MAIMAQETEVISCPACKHLLRVPPDWLGQPVQCPECRATFKAPVRTADGLGDPELISRPAAPPGPAAGKRLDPMLLLPAFGLMLCGAAGMIVNGVLAYQFLADAAGAKDYLRGQFSEFRKFGFGANDPPAEQDRLDNERADAWVGILRVALPAMGLAAALAFLGGLSVALRWNYRLAQLGCMAAAFDLTGLCCVPGAAAGVWGLLMLNSSEARAHFGK
jgi:hypothetical protein